MTTPIDEYIQLRHQELELQAKLRAAKTNAEIYALDHGQVGGLGQISGAKVTIKLVKAKKQETADTETLREWIELRREKNERENLEAIATKDDLIHELQSRIANLEAERQGMVDDAETLQWTEELEQIYQIQQSELVP